jgi:hypothetical protein
MRRQSSLLPRAGDLTENLLPFHVTRKRCSSVALRYPRFERVHGVSKHARSRMTGLREMITAEGF